MQISLNTAINLPIINIPIYITFSIESKERRHNVIRQSNDLEETK
jgi:hypothetical protein